MPYGGTGASPGGSGLTVAGGLVSSGTMVANGAQTFGWVLGAITLLILGLVALRVFMLKRSAPGSAAYPSTQ